MTQTTDTLIERLTRPIIGIENRTAQEAFDIMADRITSALRSTAKEVDRLREALKPFAACADELDGSQDVPRAPDGEWAKFRLLTDDYRRARTALTPADPGKDTSK